MRTLNVLLLLVCLGGLILEGCSGSGTDPVMMPTQGADTESCSSRTHLWGCYDVYIDPVKWEVSAVANRQALFTANVVNFINGKPAGLSFKINEIPSGPDYVDVDIDVSITHPFPGMPQYNGYDVRGVFMGDGSKTLAYNSDLRYPAAGTDQMMMPDPDDGIGGPDGYTRWFNRSEFSMGGMPLFQYTQGKMATPGFDGNATLCPYRYFADSLGKDEDLWTWLSANASKRGVFTSGASNTRNYYLRFPNGKGIKYGYAIIANWSGPEQEHHPSNAPEAVACKVTDNSKVYYVDPANNGGNIILDVSIWDWDSEVSGGVMTDYRIFVDSTVLSSPYEFTADDMTPVGGGEHYSTYHVDIDADNVTGNQGNEYWVIVECADENYTNPYNVPNLAGQDKLAACFRYPLFVSNQMENHPPIITGITDDIPPEGLNTSVSSANTSVTYTALFTDPDPGQTHTTTWYIEEGSASAPSDPPDTMPYNWAPKPLGEYKIWVKVDDGFGPVTGGPYSVTKVPPGWARTWGGPYDWDQGWRVAVDSSGNIYIAGCFQGTNVDFDPGSSSDLHTSNGSFDSFLSKFDSSGNFVWAKTWGGTSEDIAKGVAVSGNDVYVCGYYRNSSVDFNPDPGQTDIRTCAGDRDAYVSKFDTSGNYKWVAVWGTINREWGGEMVATDSNSNVYVGGWNESPWQLDLRSYSSSGTLLWSKTWLTGCSYCKTESVAVGGSVLYMTGYFSGSGVDFDPGPGTVQKTSSGTDAFVCRFSTSGTFDWVVNWGNYEVWPKCVNIDPSGNICVGGTFAGTNVDFDPGSGTDLHSAGPGGDRNAFLSKFNASGSFIWARSWGSSSEDWTCGLDFDSSGNVYIAGRFRGPSIDLDPDPVKTDNHNNGGGSSNTFDCFASRFDPSGQFVWGRTIGGSGHDYANDIVMDLGCVTYIGAFSSYNMDFDPGAGTDLHSTNGSEDIFVTRMSVSGSW